MRILKTEAATPATPDGREHTVGASDDTSAVRVSAVAERTS